jgi:hypothetical protein
LATKKEIGEHRSLTFGVGLHLPMKVRALGYKPDQPLNQSRQGAD